MCDLDILRKYICRVYIFGAARILRRAEFRAARLQLHVCERPTPTARPPLLTAAADYARPRYARSTPAVDTSPTELTTRLYHRPPAHNFFSALEVTLLLRWTQGGYWYWRCSRPGLTCFPVLARPTSRVVLLTASEPWGKKYSADFWARHAENPKLFLILFLSPKQIN